MSKSETRDEVAPTDDVIWVEKPKCVVLEGQNKLEPIQPFGFPPSSVVLVNLEPTNPEDVHPDHIRHCWSMEDIKSEHSEDLCIGVRVDLILREGHHMRSILQVHPVLATSEVVCCVVDGHGIPLFKATLRNVELVAVLLSECGWIGVVLDVENASEKVILEFRNKVLLRY
jgi:hypothetical protein